MITKQPTTSKFKIYRRAWKLFDFGLISKEELVEMLEACQNPKMVKGNSYVN
ncbi:hypothetical protein [Psychrobacillus sp. FSL H8-0487]|uniref:hypothetical protein n=1 Tax=Psychrobacillus sp. FSL H8-0487 TaxID=2921391 RepID=UPI0030F4DE4B